MNLVSLLKYCDLFGAPFLFHLNSNQKYHRSSIGGIGTLVIYSIILIYASVSLKQWANWEMLSQVTTVHAATFTNATDQLNTLELYVRFNSYENQTMTMDIDQQFFIVVIENGDSTYTVVPYKDGAYNMNITFLSTVSNSGSVTNQASVNIFSCDPSLVTTGSCADPESIENFVRNNALYVSVEFNLSYINTDNYQPVIVHQIVWIGMESNWTHISSLELTASGFEIYKPAVIQTPEYVYSFTQKNQVIETQSEQYGILSLVGYPTPKGHFYAQQFFSVDFVTDLTKIQYPSIYTVVGNIGAIGGILMYMRVFFNMYNSRQAEEELIRKVIKTIYPQYQKIKVCQKMFKISSVTYDDKMIDPISFLKFENSIKLKIMDHLRVSDLLIGRIKVDLSIENNIYDEIEKHFEIFPTPLNRFIMTSQPCSNRSIVIEPGPQQIR